MPELTLESLAERLAVVEAELRQLRQSPLAASRTKNWRSVIGMFPNDDFMKQVDELGREYRQSQGAEFEE